VDRHGERRTAAHLLGSACHGPVSGGSPQAMKRSEFSAEAPGHLVVSVVLPVYNEAKVLETLISSLDAAIRDTGCDAEIVFVNDGSRDGSAEVLDRLAARDDRVRVLHFSRNFGHQAALQAGLTHATGDVVVVMDSDMQDDP